MITVDKSFYNTQIYTACHLMQKFTRESTFWDFYKKETGKTSGIPVLVDEVDIENHLQAMFSFNLYLKIVPYKTRNPWSSVIGHAEGIFIFENVRKINDLFLHERVGHLGHEITHLFGYTHEYQGEKTATPVVFGDYLAEYAKKRILEINPKHVFKRGGDL